MQCRHNTEKNSICGLTGRTVCSLKTEEKGGGGAFVQVCACQMNLYNTSSVHNWDLTCSF